MTLSSYFRSVIIKSIKIGVFFFLPSLGLSQIIDSAVNNPFDKVSIYKRIQDVYIGNFGLAKYSLLSPFEDNSWDLLEILPATSDSNFYTDIFCTLGSVREGVVEFNHHQLLGRNVNLNLNYFTSSSEGHYLRQKAVQSKFFSELNFLSSNKKYGIDFKSLFKRRTNQLNGGINDTAFTALFDSNAIQTLFPINLSDADMGRKSNIIDLQHYYSFMDSVNDLSFFKIKQQFNYERERFDYVDLKNDFYSNAFIDTNESSDSLKIDYLTHNLLFERVIGNKAISLGHSISYIDYKADSVFIYSVMQSGLANFYWKQKNFMFHSANSYTFFGLLQGNFYSRNRFTLKSDSGFLHAITAQLNVFETTPKLYYHQYHSNRNSWNVNLQNERGLSLNVSGANDDIGLSLSGQFELRNNHVYFDSSFTPNQTNIAFFQVGATKLFAFNNWLKWLPKICFQGVSSTVNIELPSFFVFNRVYVEGSLFKKVMRFKVGMDLIYYPNFYAKAYNPSFDHFYVQNKTQSGNYPYFDVFAEFYLKNYLAIFIKSEHVTNGLFGPGYLASPTYRTQDRTIKVGVKWRLFN